MEEKNEQLADYYKSRNFLIDWLEYAKKSNQNNKRSVGAFHYNDVEREESEKKDKKWQNL